MSDSIRFILNGTKVEVSGLSPNMTLLQYLRTQKRLTGTKEGCAEGDCGACTAIVGTLQNGRVDYKALNACIAFLPAMDGKEIITVEHLKSADGKLHPVQKSMVDCHGSQCGFCTPGFVMSLTALCHKTPKASKDEIQDAIAGNLCRCTGYRPILDAAERACSKGKPYTLASHPQELEKIHRTTMFRYEHDGKKFFAPVTTDELAHILAEYPNATLLAGGTDVGLWVTKMHKDLDVVIYTPNVKELHNIEFTRAGLEIGAAASYTEAFEALADYDESFEILLKRLGSVQIRNAGTVGGNIANGSPIGDGMPPLIALKAQLVLRSRESRRTLNMEDYFLAYKKQDRRPGEFLEKIIVPPKASGTLFKTYKISKRFDQDISAVCSAFSLCLENGVIKEARIVFGGMAATPKRALKTEEAVIGKKWNEGTVAVAERALNQDYSPLSDMRASSEYRGTVAKNLFRRFFIETTEPNVETEVYRYAQ